jgi:hypothetical protein
MALDVSDVATADAVRFASTQASGSSDERWAAWRAKGAAHDREVRRKLALAAPIAIVVAVIVYALLGR